MLKKGAIADLSKKLKWKWYKFNAISVQIAFANLYCKNFKMFGIFLLSQHYANINGNAHFISTLIAQRIFIANRVKHFDLLLVERESIFLSLLFNCNYAKYLNLLCFELKIFINHFNVCSEISPYLVQAPYYVKGEGRKYRCSFRLKFSETSQTVNFMK